MGSNEINVSDTPDLDNVSSWARGALDPEHKKRIESAQDVSVEILESGRVRPADLETINVTICALKSAHVRAGNKLFSLIMKSCDWKDLELVHDDYVNDFTSLHFAGLFKVVSVEPYALSQGRDESSAWWKK